MGKKDFSQVGQTAAQQVLNNFFDTGSTAPGPETEKPKEKKPRKKVELDHSRTDQRQPGGEVPPGYVLKKESKSERATILFRHSTLKALREKAAQEGKSFNELCNEILENYLKGE